MKPLVSITLLSLVLGYLVLAPANPAWDAKTTDKQADAAVTGIRVSGEPGAYTFHVGLKSDDTGCEQYADWWEVVDSKGTLLYRRILAHSHVDEQPFTRSGGPVAISKEQVVIVRGHMNKAGYGSNIFKGSVGHGFSEHAANSDFASNLESSPPLPEGCAF